MERTLVALGLALLAAGMLFVGLGYLLGHIGRGGRLLPGDIIVSRPGFTFVFPIVTGLVLSLVLTVLLWVIAALRR